MTMHMVRYKVKPDQATRNEELVRAVFAELDEVEPTGLRYAAFKLDDGVTFIHLISHNSENGPIPGRQLQALGAFHAGIRERSEEAPVRTAISVVGSFRLLAEDVELATPRSGPKPH